MSLPGNPTPPKRPRALVRMPTPGDDAESYHQGWIIYEREDTGKLAIPVGPPVTVAGFQALQITGSTKWFLKIASGHATH